MGRPWDSDLVIATVPKGDTAKPVTLILPYYENAAFFLTQVTRWLKFPEDVFEHLSLIVVDDGSPTKPLADALMGSAWPYPIKAFRIDVDVRWNWLAARNIGAHHAKDGWVMLTDMDHVLPVETARQLVYGQHDQSKIYGFSRYEHTGAKLSAHPNSWFMTKAMFWNVGGYDENLSGHYGTDGDWRRRMAAKAEIQIMPEHLERHEYVEDSSTTTYLRKQPEDAAVKRIIGARGKNWTPKTLSFPYHELALEGR